MSNDYMSWAGNSDIGLHLPYIHQRARGTTTVLELGVRHGCSTAALLAGVQEGDGRVWSVDILWPGTPADGWLSEARWTFIFGDDMDPKVQACTPKTLDLLMIDTSHRYQHTLDELTFYGPKVRTGGVILLHDTELESAPGSADENDRGFPVRRAIEDWCRGKFLEPEWREGCNGLGVIEVT